MARPSKPPVGAGLFPADAAPAAKTAGHRANIDGGSRGNPGPASYGVVIRDAKGEIIAKLKKYIGRTTNNVAEYYGLIAALDYAQAHGIRTLQIESDSELLVKQMRGQYKVKSEDLRPLFERAKKMSATFEHFAIHHVYREQNQEADALANEAMDESAGKPAAAATGAPTAVKSVSSSGVAGAATAESKAAAVAKPALKPAPKPDTSGIPRKVRARYRSGILYPLEDLDLEDGIEVEIYLRATPKKEKL
ncbi:MAG TPA: reverse transcriptase-like protein [Candidatus Acidoferrum sp.]|nr:reverse transcriptase-like protein [Candidatus Acidoferrum sp.]